METYAERIARCSTQAPKKRGRLAGVGNTREHTEAVRVGMLAYHEAKRNRPGVCDECGRRPDGRDDLDLFQGRWLCGLCLVDEMEPLTIEQFVWTGTSNLGAASERRMRVEEEI